MDRNSRLPVADSDVRSSAGVTTSNRRPAKPYSRASRGAMRGSELRAWATMDSRGRFAGIAVHSLAAGQEDQLLSRRSRRARIPRGRGTRLDANPPNAAPAPLGRNQKESRQERQGAKSAKT